LNVKAPTLAGSTTFTIVPTGTTCTTTATGTTALPFGALCILRVKFAPGATGVVTGTITINSSNGAPVTVSLSGKGSAPVASVSPTSLTFPIVNVGNTSATQTVTLSNTGDVPLGITSPGIVVSPGFSRPTGAAGGSCPPTAATGSVPAGGSCTIITRFSPTVAGGPGAKTGTITINDDDPVTNPQVVTLSGTAVVQLPLSTVSTANVAFGNVQTAIAAALAPTQDIIVTNTGTGTIPMTLAISVTGTGFTRITTGVTPNCGTSLAAGAFCIIRVRFLPATGGDKLGTVTITTNSNNVPGTIQNVALTGTGTIAAANDTASTGASTSTNPVSFAFSVRANDTPANAGTVTINSSSFVPTTPAGAATATATVNANNQVVWTTSTTGANAGARAASRRGTYTVNYTLTNGTATATATYILTVT